MNGKRILKLKKMGMDFYQDEKLLAISDCGNFRLRAENIPAKDGNLISVVDFGRGNKYDFYKKNGERRRTPKLATEYHLHANASYERLDESGHEMCYHYRPIEEEAWNGDYLYRLADILKCVNSISAEPYTDIEII